MSGDSSRTAASRNAGIVRLVSHMESQGAAPGDPLVGASFQRAHAFDTMESCRYEEGEVQAREKRADPMSTHRLGDRGLSVVFGRLRCAGESQGRLDFWRSHSRWRDFCDHPVAR